MVQYPLEAYAPTGTAPPRSIIPTDEMRAFARLSGLEQDGELALAQGAALDYITGPDGYLLSVWRRQWMISVTAPLPSCGGAIDLRLSAPVSVDVFEYKAKVDDSSYIAIPASEFFLVRERRLVCPFAAHWPRAAAWRLTFTAGFANPTVSRPADELPAQLRQAIKILTLALWEDRSGEMCAPKAVDAICRQYGGGAFA